MPRERRGKKSQNYEEEFSEEVRSQALHSFKFESFHPESEDWEYFIQRFQIQLKLHRITDDEEKRDLLIVRVGPPSFKILVDHFRPRAVETVGFGEIIDVLNKFFGKSYCPLSERVKFTQRHRHGGESVYQYVNALRSIAARCDFGASLEERLRDQLIIGIRNVNWQRQLLKDHPSVTSDFKAVEKTALQAELADIEQKRLTEASSDTRGEDISRQALAIKGNSSQPIKSPTVLVRGEHCFRCGNSRHQVQESCPADGKTCHKCKGFNHLSRACLKTGAAVIKGIRRRTNRLQSANSSSSRDSVSVSSADRVYTIHMSGKKIMVPVHLGRHRVEMLYDSGATDSVISKSLWEKLGTPKLRPIHNLVAYSGVTVPTLGEAMVQVKAFNKRLELPVIVTATEDVPLFGLNWALSFDCPLPSGARICTITADQPVSATGLSLIKRFEAVFAEGRGPLTGHEATIRLTENAVTKKFKPRPVPFALKAPVEAELQRLVKEGVLEAVDPAVNPVSWASPIVVTVKPNGNIRICADFKVTINPFISDDNYPLPTFEDILAQLNGGKYFTVLDLKDAYLQMPVARDSQEYLTIVTHIGYFRYKRLPFGVKTAPPIFQRTMGSILQGIPKVAWLLDDIIVGGESVEEHLALLEQVLDRLKRANIRLHRDKCKWFQSSVKYLGHQLDREGIRPTEEHVEAILKMPDPSNTRELRSLVGSINYYQRFIPNLQCICSPLHRLLKKGHRWDWSPEDSRIVAEVKKTLTSTEHLVHYNPQLPIIVTSDASERGVGAVMFHKLPDGSEKPVAFASRTLSTSERNYSVVDREALGIIFAVKKFHLYLIGRKFVLRTDHRPLVHIFGPSKEIPKVANSRLTRWGILLGAYDYDIEYQQGKDNGPADILSRLPVGEPVKQVSDYGSRILHLRLEDLQVSKKRLIKETATDPCTRLIKKYLSQPHWPDKSQVPPELRPYYEKREELACEEDIVTWKGRIVVPTTMRTAILDILHEGHPGISAMRSLARFHVWWPNIDRHIEDFVNSCKPCQQGRPNHPEMPLYSWTIPAEPWSRVHVDFAGPYQGCYWFVLVDATSKWIEIEHLKTTTSNKTISLLQRIFSRFGLPKFIVSDNGPQFTSLDFQKYCHSQGIQHIRTSPYHPKSNGLAERTVRTFKERFSASKSDGLLDQRLDKFLLSLRTTPNTTTGRRPDEVLLGRHIRTKLTLLQPDPGHKQELALLNQKKYHDKGCRERHFQVGEKVWALNKNGKGYEEGRVIKKTGLYSYIVNVSGLERKMHADHLRNRLSCGGEDVMSS